MRTIVKEEWHARMIWPIPSGNEDGLSPSVAIVTVYSDETPARVRRPGTRAALSMAEITHATEIGGQLTIKEALDLAMVTQTAAL